MKIWPKILYIVGGVCLLIVGALVVIPRVLGVEGVKDSCDNNCLVVAFVFFYGGIGLIIVGAVGLRRAVYMRNKIK